MTSKIIKFILRILFTILFLALAVSKLDFRNVYPVFCKIHLPFYLAGLMVFLISPYISTCGMRLLLRSLGVHLELFHVLKTNFVAFFIAFAAEIVRWMGLSHEGQRRGEAFLAIIMEKWQGLFVFYSFLVTGLCFFSKDLTGGLGLKELGLIAWLVPVLGSALFAMAVLFFYGGLQARIERGCQALAEKGHGKFIGARLKDLMRVLGHFRSHKRPFFQALLLAFLNFASGAVCFYLFLSAVEVRMPWHVLIWLNAVSGILFMFPVTFYGMGMREAFYVYFFAKYGVVPEKAFMIGLMTTASYFIFPLIGAVFFFVGGGPVKRNQRGFNL